MQKGRGCGGCTGAVARQTAFCEGGTADGRSGVRAAMIFLFLVFVAFIVLWVVGWLESRDDGL
jgi:predicted nucleic acid-binding Zn ribbon protein